MPRDRGGRVAVEDLVQEKKEIRRGNLEATGWTLFELWRTDVPRGGESNFEGPAFVDIVLKHGHRFT